MKLGAKPEGLPERIALALNLAPMPLFHTQIAFNAARSIMAAAALGVFEALGRGERSAEEVAAACRTHPRATRQLLNCLVGIGYARCFDGRYGMRRTHRKWLLRAGSNSIVDKLSFLSIEWDLMGRLEGFVRSGEALDIHRTMSKKQWALYQDAACWTSAVPMVSTPSNCAGAIPSCAAPYSNCLPLWIAPRRSRRATAWPSAFDTARGTP